MTAANFKRSMPHILAEEGKYSNHPSDPGGRTYEGVTQRVWDAYCAQNGIPRRDLTKNTGTWKDWAKHRDAIYKAQYWDAIKGDEMPSGLDYELMDGAVNSGPGRSIKWLQKALGVAADGVIGVATRAALKKADIPQLISDIAAERMKFLRALNTWPTFGKGWAARVSRVKATALAWAAQKPSPKPVPVQDTGKATSDSAKPTPTTATADGMIGAGGVATGAGIGLETARDTLAPMADGNAVIGYIVVGLTLLGIAVTVGGFVWRWHNQRKAEKLKEALA